MTTIERHIQAEIDQILAREYDGGRISYDEGLLLTPPEVQNLWLGKSQVRLYDGKMRMSRVKLTHSPARMERSQVR